MAAAVTDATIAYTAFTPAPITIQILKLMSFTNIDTQRIVFAPFCNLLTLCRRAPEITFDTARIGGYLTIICRTIACMP